MKILEKRHNLHRQTEQIRRNNIDLQKQLETMEPLSLAGSAWTMIAHEMNNLLTPHTNYAQLALNNPEDTALSKKALEKALMLSKQAAEVLQQVPVLAGQRKFERENYYCRDLVKEVFAAAARDFTKDGIKIVIDIEQGLTLYVDPIGMRQVLLNLILNAREAMLQRGGKLHIQARKAGGFAEIRIWDTGCGMTAEQAAKIFEPFYTTKDGSGGTRKGAGIGLSFCKRVVEEHGGTIEVNSSPGEGTAFLIRLPKNA